MTRNLSPATIHDTLAYAYLRGREARARRMAHSLGDLQALDGVNAQLANAISVADRIGASEDYALAPGLHWQDLPAYGEGEGMWCDESGFTLDERAWFRRPLSRDMAGEALCIWRDGGVL